MRRLNDFIILYESTRLAPAASHTERGGFITTVVTTTVVAHVIIVIITTGCCCLGRRRVNFLGLVLETDHVLHLCLEFSSLL